MPPGRIGVDIVGILLIRPAIDKGDYTRVKHPRWARIHVNLHGINVDKRLKYALRQSDKWLYLFEVMPLVSHLSKQRCFSLSSDSDSESDWIEVINKELILLENCWTGYTCCSN